MRADYATNYDPQAVTAVDRYWSAHTVRTRPFATAAASLAFLDWRSAKYPLFHELMGLWGEHSRDVVLDYGCGPANDMTGFLVHGKAREVIGADVSTTALALARSRLGLHDSDRWRLVKVSDADPTIPLATGSIDHIYCQGVLHHVSDPAAILAEFRRVLRPGGTVSIMAYSRDSLWVHLYVAWQRQIVEGIDAGLAIERAFSRSTDGESCPISRAWRQADFTAMCEAAGFAADYRGGYFNQSELDLWRREGHRAIADPRLGSEQRDFLVSLRGDPPTYRGLLAGVAGVYWLRR